MNVHKKDSVDRSSPTLRLVERGDGGRDNPRLHSATSALPLVTFSSIDYGTSFEEKGQNVGS